ISQISVLDRTARTILPLILSICSSFDQRSSETSRGRFIHKHRQDIMAEPGQEKNLFTQGRGVRQGCSLSPTLFNIYINDLAVLLEQSAAPGLTLNHTEVKFLLYADELVLLSPTERGLQQHLDLLEKYCQNWALTVNPDKSKIMIFQKKARSQESRHMFHLGDTALDHTLSYNYLGLTISASGGLGLAGNALKEKACRALYSIRKQFSKIHIPIRIWLKIFHSVILPIVLYDCQFCSSEQKVQKNYPLFPGNRLLYYNALREYCSFQRRSEKNSYTQTEIGTITEKTIPLPPQAIISRHVVSAMGLLQETDMELFKAEEFSKERLFDPIPKPINIQRSHP
ncbi:hypothetical protein NFI96_008369, partial [Prochilodus magdalenae]